MKHYLFILLVMLSHGNLRGQSNNTWTAFWNKDTTLRGYKDKNGIVKIEPKFKHSTRATTFVNIIVVTEDGDGKSYYLTKSGEVVGRDSVYIFDNSFDCESEGFICFEVRQTGKVGMFNRNGKIAIPAEYDYLHSVRNGMIIARKGANKKQLGEHYTWEGGQEMLIDTNNRVLINDFKYDYNLNLFSSQVSAQPNSDATRQNFKTNSGQYLSVIDFEKEFKSWLKSSLLENFTKNQLLEGSYKEITFWKQPTGWTQEAKSSFIDRNYGLIKEKLLQLNSKDCKYHIFHDGLNPFIYHSVNYKDFFDSCGESKDWIYPIKSVVINYTHNNQLLQDHFDFLRTDHGYKLISVTIRKGEIK